VGIEKEVFIDDLEDIGLDPSCSIEDLATNPKVHSIIEQEIATGNEQLASFETIKKFIILPFELSVESGHLTPSLKLKKKVLMKECADKIEQLYKS
jgi:long-chain acyl-CoA synthetase